MATPLAFDEDEFARLVAQGITTARAFNQVTGKRYSDKSCRTLGPRLARRPDVASRIAELREATPHQIEEKIDHADSVRRYCEVNLKAIIIYTTPFPQIGRAGTGIEMVKPRPARGKGAKRPKASSTIDVHACIKAINALAEINGLKRLPPKPQRPAPGPDPTRMIEDASYEELDAAIGAFPAGDSK